MAGWGRRAAQDVIAETGVDMSRFRTPGHLASWCGRTQLERQSGKRAGQARHKKGNRYVAAVVGETSVAAGKTDTREGARQRQAKHARKQLVETRADNPLSSVLLFQTTSPRCPLGTPRHPAI
jgi:transposase